MNFSKNFFIAVILIFSVAAEAIADYKWLSGNSLTGENINSSKFIGKYGWFGCYGGIIKYTENHGITWNNSNTGLTSDINKINAYDTSMVVAVGNYKAILVSEDCGKTWQNRTPGNVSGSPAFMDCFVYDNIIWVVGGANLILRSDDKGLTWTKQFEGTLTSYAVHFFNKNSGIVAGEKHLYSTNDGGVNWYSIGTSLSFTDIYAYNEYIIFGLTSDNTLYQTVEGLSKWALVSKFNTKINGFTFLSYFDGWAAGENGELYHCTESPSGKWNKVNHSFSGRPLNSVVSVNNDTVWVVGDYGYFYKYYYEDDSMNALPSAVANAGGVYFIAAGDTLILTAERTTGRNKAYFTYNWSTDNTNVELNNSNKIQTVFKSTQTRTYKILLSINNYTRILKYDQAKIIVYDTINVIQESSSLKPINENINAFSLKKLYHVIDLELSSDFVDMQLTLNFADYRETNHLLFVNKINYSDFPPIRPELVKFDDYFYTVVNLELFDFPTKNRISENSDIFDQLIFKYNIKAGNSQLAGRKFAIYEFDETLKRWIQISNQVQYNYAAGLSLSYTASDMCIIGLFPVTELESSDVNIYPNPFLPNDGNLSTGRYYDGNDNGSGIYFSGSSLRNANIKIVNLAGRVVFEHNNSNNEFYQWNVLDNNNKLTPSGLYYVVIKSDNGKCIRKLLIAH